MKRSHVFRGKDALREYLDPSKHSPMPLVELPAELNPYKQKGVEIYAKIGALLPLMNIKSVPAYAMTLGARNRDNFCEVHTVVESSSFNTIASIAPVARALGIKKIKAVVDKSSAPFLIDFLRLLGIDVMLYPDLEESDRLGLPSRADYARQLGKLPGWLNFDQNANRFNPAAHEQVTGPELWRQTKGAISLFGCSLGTTGTLCGVSRYLKRRNSNIVTLGVVNSPGNFVTGARTEKLLSEIQFNWRSAANELIEVEPQMAFSYSLQLLRLGIFAGPSAGLALAGTIEYLGELESKGRLSELSSCDGRVIAVFMCPDSPFIHLERYQTFLPEQAFGELTRISLDEAKLCCLR